MASHSDAKEENSEKTVKNKPIKQSKNNCKFYRYEDIQRETNALSRGRMVLKYHMTECILNGEPYPTVIVYRNYYRTHFGTGSEDEGDIKRLEATYDKYYEIFKKEIENSIQSQILCLEERVKSVITQEQIDRIRDTESSFQRNIYVQDVAVSALWIYHSLVNSQYRNMKQFSGKQETAPMSGLKGYFSKLKDMKIIKNGCNNPKAKALRKILEYMGWIEVVDSHYSFVSHIAMRYVLLEVHPYYKSYEKIVGPEVVKSWRDYKAENIKQALKESA